MVKNPAHFVGRIREANDILAKIQSHSSVSVVGERRIGKSSLLFYLANACKKQFTDRRVAYLDFMSIELRTLEGFVYALLGSLGIEFDEGEMTKNPNLILTRKLRQLNLDQLPPVVFLDEFDKIQELPPFFNDDFLENLRFLCNSGFVCLVTASKGKPSSKSQINSTAQLLLKSSESQVQQNQLIQIWVKSSRIKISPSNDEKHSQY